MFLRNIVEKILAIHTKECRQGSVVVTEFDATNDFIFFAQFETDFAIAGKDSHPSQGGQAYLNGPKCLHLEIRYFYEVLSGSF